jgi:GTP-binding protein HflX
MITALNKIDGLPHSEMLGAYLVDLANSVAISALTGEGIPELMASIEDVLTEELVHVALLLPYQRGDLLGLFHQRGVIEREEHGSDGARVWGKLPARLAPRFQAYAWPPIEDELT